MTMTHAEHVRTGAAAIRRVSNKNPMEILTTLRANDPNAGFEYQFAKWRKMVERNEQMLEAALMHAFRNMWSVLDRDDAAEAARKRSPQERAAEAAAAAQRDADLKARFTQFVFMEMILPVCGKPLKDATFAEVRKEGGLLAKIGSMGKPTQIVGQVLTEKQLQKLWR